MASPTIKRDKNGPVIKPLFFISPERSAAIASHLRWLVNAFVHLLDEAEGGVFLFGLVRHVIERGPIAAHGWYGRCYSMAGQQLGVEECAYGLSLDQLPRSHLIVMKNLHPWSRRTVDSWCKFEEYGEDETMDLAVLFSGYLCCWQISILCSLKVGLIRKRAANFALVRLTNLRWPISISTTFRLL